MMILTLRGCCFRLVAAFSVITLLAVPAAAEPDVNNTRLLAQPAVSARHVAFVYADDLWVAHLDGSGVRRLTSDTGVEGHPVFSPDGTQLAFSAQYDGNVDVYTIPVAGGSPTRLTWHPGDDTVRGFAPDGRSVLFSSARHVFTRRYTQLFTVPLGGGMPEQLPIPNAVQACFSPDGAQIAYTPLADRSPQWKHYRGGTHSQIWIYRRADHHVEPIPHNGERVNDTDPQWIGSAIYFRSDRNGEFNLFAYDLRSKAVKQLTQHRDFPVLGLGAGGGRVIYEQAGYLHLFEPTTGATRRLKIGVASDLVEARPRFVKGAKHVRRASLSPSGARAVFDIRGEIVTVPAEKGDPRNLTETPGIHERSPIWSSNGRVIAYFSDEGGAYRLHLRFADGHGKPKSYALRGAGFYMNPVWSPDGRKIAYLDNSQSLFWIDLVKDEVRKIDSEPLYLPSNRCRLRPAWSPDSAWIVYARGNKAGYSTVYAYELASGKSRPITDGMSDALDPVFDGSGRYVYFLASTDAGPVNQWFSQAREDMRLRRSIYLVVLRKDLPSPLARESDEERVTVTRRTEPGKPETTKPVAPKPPAPPAISIDFEGIDQRVLALPEPAGVYTDLKAGPAGQIFYLQEPSSGAGGSDDAKEVTTTSLKRFDLAKRKSERLQSGVRNYVLAANGRKALVDSPPETWSIVDVSGPPIVPGKGKLKLDGIEIRIDPRAEWAQIFDEAWRINRDYFYDPGMHGADWVAVKKKYAVFLPELATRGDLDRVLRWMLSELAVGHSTVVPGERLYEKRKVPGGLLGADYEVADGRYRFKRVYGGLNWCPELRAPLTVPGVNVQPGEYLLAVRGVELRPPTEVYSQFENTAAKSIEITVGPKPDGSGSRRVTVEPLADELSLRNRAWVEGNRKKVQQATGGRVAYVYVPDTASEGHTYFKRYFYPQCDKQAIIVDERFNGGGLLADYYIEHLRRPFVAMWATRYGDDLKTPSAGIHGRFRRRPAAVDVPQVPARHADRQTHLGRTGRHHGLSDPHGRRPRDRAQPGHLDQGRLGGGKRRCSARHRSRAVAGRGDRRPRSATGKGDPSGARRTPKTPPRNPPPPRLPTTCEVGAALMAARH
jgi:tricorn protease